ncbi:MAG: sulfotransferase [Sphingorhabdus sp.]
MKDKKIEQLAVDAAASMRGNRSADAIAAHIRLLKADPNRPDDWYNLGYLQKRSRMFDEALSSYSEALDRNVSGPEEVYLNRAVILTDALRRPEKAADELLKALAVKADYVPALLNLGNLHEDRGARDEARECYSKALAAQPGNALALMRVAEVSQIVSADDPLVGELRSAITRQGNESMDRADIGFALGRLLDSVGAYDDAFAAYDNANIASRQAGGLQYSPAATKAMIDQLIDAFDDTGLGGGNASDKAGDKAGDSPIFICGMFRSGSTLAERILAAHSGIVAGGELDLIPALVAQQLNPYPASVASANFSELRATYLSGLAQMDLKPAFLTDKRPDNFLHIGLIKRIFPSAKIIHTTRNPLDNCLSAFFAHLDPRMTYAQNLDCAADWYRQYQRLMQHWKRLYPDDIFDLSYDSVVHDPGPQIAEILDFLGLDWEDACLEPHSVTGVVRTASSWQVREPLYQRSSGRHRNYSGHIESLIEAFGAPG